jgi:hypothetical protein
MKDKSILTKLNYVTTPKIQQNNNIYKPKNQLYTMKNRYSIITALALTALAGCATMPDKYDTSRPKYIGAHNGVEGFVGDKGQIERFALRHKLPMYDINEKEGLTEGVTMSRHRYIAATSKALIDWNATDGPTKAPNAVKR